MKRVAFAMKLKKDCADEYKRRHDAIWPELSTLLKRTGIQQYSIFLDDSNNTLFGYLKVEDPALLDKLRDEPLMWKWWNYMADIMDTNPDHSPVSMPLQEVFYLP
jgi:L-rhamnose mutarotase